MSVQIYISAAIRHAARLLCGCALPRSLVLGPRQPRSRARPGRAISAALFGWIARSCARGKNRARITGTALFALAVLITAYSLGPGAETTLQLILTVLGALIGLAAVVLLWQRSSSAWFTLFNRPHF